MKDLLFFYVKINKQSVIIKKNKNKGIKEFFKAIGNSEKVTKLLVSGGLA